MPTATTNDGATSGEFNLSLYALFDVRIFLKDESKKLVITEF